MNTSILRHKKSKTEEEGVCQLYRKPRDTAILEFIEEYKGSNIDTIANLFFKDSNNAYTLASNRLRIMYESKVLKRYRRSVSDKFIYYRGDKPISIHDSKALEVYSRLSNMGTVVDFKLTLEIPKAKRVIDALVVLDKEVIIDSDIYIETHPLIIEIDYTHNTSITKVRDIYKSNYFQDMYGFFPKILIIKDNNWGIKLKDKSMSIITLNWNLDGIENIFKEG